MGSAAKKDQDQNAEVVELSLAADREQGLSKNFEDPSLSDLLAPDGEAAQVSLVEEAAEAVKELVTEVKAGAEPNLENFGDLNLIPPGGLATEIPPGGLATEIPPGGQLTAEPFDPDPAPPGQEPAALAPLAAAEEPSGLFATAVESGSPARWEMAEKLFELVACERSFDDLVEGCLAALLQGLGGQAGAVLELDEANQAYFFRSSIGGGDPEKVKAFRVPFHKGIVGHVGESRQPILLRDLEDDQMQMRAISMSAGFEAKTCMAAPVIVGGQIFGVVEIFNRKDGGFFDEQDLQLFEDGVRMMAKVLEVRFLMAELLRRAG